MAVTTVALLTAGGLAQKIFYFHVPVAFGVYVTGAVCFVASAIYLVRPTEGANAWARATGKQPRNFPLNEYGA